MMRLLIKISVTGTFFRYDPINDINGPAIRGFSAGTYYDGSVREDLHQASSSALTFVFSKRMLDS